MPGLKLRPPWSADIQRTLRGENQTYTRLTNQLRSCREMTMKGQSLIICVSMCVFERKEECVEMAVDFQIKFGQVGSKCISLIGLLHMEQMAKILMRQ